MLHRLQGADLILHAGDVVDIAILNALETVAPVLAVQGNCCRGVLRGRLPLKREEVLNGLCFGMLHGHLVDLEDPAAVLAGFSPQVQVVFHGHTHLARKEKLGERWIFKPGSLMQPRYSTPPSYGWATWQDGELTLVHKPF